MELLGECTCPETKYKRKKENKENKILENDSKNISPTVGPTEMPFFCSLKTKLKLKLNI